MPDTPHAFTGGGGEHWWFTIPEGMNLGASGNLTKLGYPGVEYKGYRGQVVVEPSIHPDTGDMYEWELGLRPGEVEIQPIPESLLALLQRSKSFDLRQDSKFTNEGGSSANGESYSTVGTAVSESERLARFTSSYTAGERNDTIARLTGYFKSRSICHHCTTGFLLNWQKDYFTEPLTDRELGHVVHGLYQREGKLSFVDNCKHEDDIFLRRMQRDTDPAYVAAQRAPTASGKPSEPAPVIDMEEEKTNLRAKTRSIKMKKAIEDFTLSNVVEIEENESDQPNDSLTWHDKKPYLSTSRTLGRQLAISGTKSTFLLYDPALAPSKQDLLTMEEDRPILSENDLRRLNSCGASLGWMCADHGNQGNGLATCKHPFHGACASHATFQLRQVALPELEEGETYLETWFTGLVRIRGGTGEIADNLETAVVNFQEAVSKTNKQKDTKGLVVARSLSFRLERPTTRVTYRVMIKEEFPGQADANLKKIGKATNSAITATRRFDDPEDAVVQLMLNSMSNLNHLHDIRDTGLFEAYRLALKGKKSFQTMGVLWGLMKGVKKREKPLCPVCGAELQAVVLREDDAGSQPGQYAPTGTDPPWR